MHGLKYLLQAARLPRSVFYYWQARRQQPDVDRHTKARIQAVFHDHKARYGYRRVTLELQRQGLPINHKKVQRLMQDMDLRAKVRRRRYVSYRGEMSRIADNRLNREFYAPEPRQKWVTDVTAFTVAGRRLYLSPVMDLFNQEIVAYRVSRSPNAKMVNDMLDDARGLLGPEERPLLHSDQGWLYQLEGFRERLAASRMTQSMSRKGNCLDNAVIENFFGHLKSECFNGEKFESISELEAEIHDYIDYYNHRRIKAKLKGLSPVAYRTQAFGGSA